MPTRLRGTSTRSASEAAEVGAAGRGTLRCGAVAPAAHLDVAPLLAGLVGDRPAVRVQLDVAGTEVLANAVAEGRLPFALCSAPRAGLGLRFEPLFHEPIVAVVAASSRLGRASASTDAPVTGCDLAAEPVIVSEAGCAYRGHVEDAFVAAGLTLDARAEVGSTRRGGRRRPLGHGRRPRAGRRPRDPARRAPSSAPSPNPTWPCPSA